MMRTVLQTINSIMYSCRVIEKCVTRNDMAKHNDKTRQNVQQCLCMYHFTWSTEVFLCPVIYCKWLWIPLQDQGNAQWMDWILALKIARLKDHRCQWISGEPVCWSLPFSSLQSPSCLFSFGLLMLFGQLSELTLWTFCPHPRPKSEGSIWESDLVWGLFRNGAWTKLCCYHAEAHVGVLLCLSPQLPSKVLTWQVKMQCWWTGAAFSSTPGQQVRHTARN